MGTTYTITTYNVYSMQSSGRVKFVKSTQNPPAVKAKEIVVPVEITLDSDMFEPKLFKIRIDARNANRTAGLLPDPKGKDPRYTYGGN